MSEEEKHKFQSNMLIGERDEFVNLDNQLDKMSLDSKTLIQDTPNFDSKFFSQGNVKVLTRGKGKNQLQADSRAAGTKPDKKHNRTKNKNKREKARRMRA